MNIENIIAMSSLWLIMSLISFNYIKNYYRLNKMIWTKGDEYFYQYICLLTSVIPIIIIALIDQYYKENSKK